MTSGDDTRVSSRTTCAIVGGGPAGLVLGLLLARAGIQVTVLEKHADFLRDFRGDTVHPSTLSLLQDLGLFERFDALRQSHLTRVSVPGADGGQVVLADFGRLPLRYPYIAMVPQWDLLNLLADAAGAESGFTLLREHAVTGVVRDDDRVAGIDYDSPAGRGRLYADLTIACDGRWSVVRQSVGLSARDFPVGFDVWWYRVPTDRRGEEALLPRIGVRRAAVVIPRDGYRQIAELRLKGGDTMIRQRGIEVFRQESAELLPDLAAGLAGLSSMDDVKHLDVRVDRLRRWHARGCSVSATPHTPCRRWAVLASTLPFRTRWRQRGCSPARSGKASLPAAEALVTLPVSSAGESFPQRCCSACSGLSTRSSSCGSCAERSPSHRPCSAGCSSVSQSSQRFPRS